MAKWCGAVVVIVAALSLAEAPASATQDITFDDVWVGTEDGAENNVVTVWLRGSRVVMVDRHGVMMGDAAYRLHRPGGKAGAGVTYRAEVAVHTWLDTRGKSRMSKRARGRSGGVSKVTFRVQGERVRLCGTDPSLAGPSFPALGAKAERPRGTRCMTLTRRAPERARPGGPAARGPSPPGSKVDECVRDCVRQSMPRAADAATIEAGCRRSCGASEGDDEGDDAD